MALVDEDTRAFNRIMNAFSLPKASEEEKKARTESIQEATRYATEVPFRVMELALAAFEVIQAMAENGNPNSVSDAGVGALSVRSAIMGAFLNVKINASGLKDKNFVENILQRGQEIQDKAVKFEQNILGVVNRKING